MKKHIFIGFNALNAAESRIIQALLHHQIAEVFWDADKLFLESPYHDAGLFMRRYKKEWPYYKSNPFNSITTHYTTPKTIHITGRKGGNSRIIPVSTKLIGMLNTLPRQSERVFSYQNTFYMGKTFRKQRQRIANKLNNPRIQRITFHTLRHWRATIEYHRTKDILYVMQFLGHRNLQHTLIYIQLEQLLLDTKDEYHVKVTSKVDEAKTLIEIGFEYVTNIGVHKLFRKRK